MENANFDFELKKTLIFSRREKMSFWKEFDALVVSKTDAFFCVSFMSDAKLDLLLYDKVSLDQRLLANQGSFAVFQCCVDFLI